MNTCVVVFVLQYYWLCGRTQTGMYMLFLKGSFQSTNQFFCFCFFLPGTQVFSCTFEPALSWFLVADQGSITSLFICWSCYSETASAPFLDAARRPPRCSLFREVGRTREGDRVDTRTEIEEGGEKSRWRNQCQAWSSFSPCIWRGGGSEVMVVDGREDEERWHWRTP